MDLETLSSYHIQDPSSYIIAWLESSNRPKYFVGDGDRFSNIKFWEPLIAFGLHVYIFHVMCEEDLLLIRQDNRGRGSPFQWQEISSRYNELIGWNHPYVTHHQINTSQATAFNIIHNILVPRLKPKLPIQVMSSNTHVFFGCNYEVHQGLLPKNMLVFLRKYAQQISYMKEEGLILGTVREKPRGIRVEGNIGCGIAYKGMGVDPLPMHPMLRYCCSLLFLFLVFNTNCLLYLDIAWNYWQHTSILVTTVCK